MKKVVAVVGNPSMFNAYEMFGLKPVFSLDLGKLEEIYIHTIRQIHPDRHVYRSAEEKRKSLEESAKINEAYRILKDPLLRAQHLWELEGCVYSFETPGVPEISASSQILMESMALRESLEEAVCPEKIGQLLQEAIKKMDLILIELHTAFEVHDRVKAHTLIEHLGYLRKFAQEAQEKLWFLEDEMEEKKGLSH